MSCTHCIVACSFWLDSVVTLDPCATPAAPAPPFNNDTHASCVCRFTRAEHSQSKQTIQQLLRELVLLRDAISRSQGISSGGGAGGGGGGRGSSGALAAMANGGGGHSAGRSQGTDGGGGSPMAATATPAASKAMSKGKLLGELQQLRVQMAEAESRQKELEAEKVCVR